MKKALIISYFFPPCNLTASNRISGWERHLPENGIYPIIITRNWEGTELTQEDRMKSSGNEIKIFQKETSEIHYLPYKSTFRDYCFIHSSKNIFFKYLSKILTLINLFLQPINVRSIPYANLYFHSRVYLKNNPDVKTVLISGNPFEQFYFGYLLKKEFPSINWIADYRDDWTTSEVTKVPFRKFQQYFEKKWVGTASFITTISPYYQKKITELVQVPGHTIYNGFSELIEKKEKSNNDEFVITYNGTLYETQEIEIFLDGYKLFLDTKPNVNVKLKFPGILIDKTQAQRVANCLMGYEEHYEMTDRLSKQQVLDIQQNSDLLLMVAHKNIKGVTSSKIFEYISLQKPFIVCPNDHDVLEEIATKSELGVVLKSTNELVEFFTKRTIENGVNLNMDNINQFRIKKQVEGLGLLINNLN